MDGSGGLQEVSTRGAPTSWSPIRESSCVDGQPTAAVDSGAGTRKRCPLDSGSMSRSGPVECSSFVRHPSRLLQRDGRPGSRSRRGEDDIGCGLGARAPAGVGDERASAAACAHPEGDTTIIHPQWRHGAAAQFRFVANGDERAAGHTDCRQADDSAQVHRQTRTSGMIEPCGIDEQYFGACVERGQRGGEDWPFPARQEPRHVGGRYAVGHVTLGNDVVGLSRSTRRRHALEVVIGFATAPAEIGPPHHGGRPRPVTPFARACAGTTISDKAAAEERPRSDRQPRARDHFPRCRGGKLSLELGEPLVTPWPCPASHCHSTILTDRQQVGDAASSYPW